MELANTDYAEKGGKSAKTHVPIELLKEIVAKWKTGYLLSADAMRRHLLESQKRQKGISFEIICKKLRI